MKNGDSGFGPAGLGASGFVLLQNPDNLLFIESALLNSSFVVFGDARKRQCMCESLSRAGQ
jgi:hypothetical protein